MPNDRLTEEGRRLASIRDDLIATGANPADMLIPLAKLNAITERDVLAVVLHDAVCSDSKCEPQVFGAEFKRADAVLASDWLAAHDAALLERVEAAEVRNPHLPEKPADGKHIFGEDGRSYRCTRCGVYNRADSPPFHEPCQGEWAESGKMRAWARDKWHAEHADRDALAAKVARVEALLVDPTLDHVHDELCPRNVFCSTHAPVALRIRAALDASETP